MTQDAGGKKGKKRPSRKGRTTAAKAKTRKSAATASQVEAAKLALKVETAPPKGDGSQKAAVVETRQEAEAAPTQQQDDERALAAKIPQAEEPTVARPAGEIAPQRRSTPRVTLLQQCMSDPSFRRAVISRFVKKLR